MADDRDPGAGDGDASPSSAASGAENAEPEFGSSEWLLRELGTSPEVVDSVDDDDEITSTSGPRGRRRRRGGVPGGAEDAEADAPAFDAPSIGSASSPVGPNAPVAPSAASGFAWNLTPGTGEDPLVAGSQTAPADPPGPDSGSLPFVTDEPELAPVLPVVSDAQEVPEGSVVSEVPEGSEEPGASEGTGVPEASESLAAPEMPVTPGAWVPLFTAPAEPTHNAPRDTSATQAADEEPAGTNVPSSASASEFAALRMPEPPEWDAAQIPTDQSWSSTLPDAPEQREEAASAPAADDADGADDAQSHGLAALLGYGPPPSDAPPSRSIIGDTTGILPIVRGSEPWTANPAMPASPAVPVSPVAQAVPNPPAPAAPTDGAPAADAAVTGTPIPAEPEPDAAESAPIPAEPAPNAAEPAQPTPPPAAAPFWTPTQPFASTPATPTPTTPPPAAFVAPVPPAEPVLPLEAPSALFEPALDGADVPTTKLDTAEMAALLAARTGDPDPLVMPETVSPPTPPAALPGIETPTVAFPAAETSTVETSAPETAVSLPEPAHAPTAPDAPDAAIADADSADPDSLSTDNPDPDDGLAALFGDVAEPEAVVESPAPTQPPAEPIAMDPVRRTPEPTAPADDTVSADDTPPADPPLFREFPPFEPSAAVEGPQFTEPVTVPQETLPAPVFAADPTVAIPSAATPPTPPTAPPPVDGASTTVLPGAPAGTGAPASGDGASPPSRPREPRKTRVLFIVAGILAVILVLIGLFALGTRLPALFGGAQSTSNASSASSPSATPTPTPTPTPTVTPKPAAPAAVGVQAWDVLGGGECIEPYTTPWAESFTVVDCATPHTAQLLYTGILNPDIAAPYPGADALAQQISGLCTVPGVIDLNAAAAYTGLQVQGTFPATEEQWMDGQRAYYCFASRSTGEAMTSSVAGPGPSA